MTEIDFIGGPGNAASQLMAIEIITELLSTTDLSELGQKLTLQLRELTGALTVMLVEHAEEPVHDHLVDVSPVRKAKIFSTDELDLFCMHRSLEKLPILTKDLQESHPLYPVLQREGIKSMLRFPLFAGNDLIGELLLFNFTYIARINENIEIISIFTQVIALALKNAISHREIEAQKTELLGLTAHLEEKVAERTKDLQIANLELKNSRLSALNLMEDAVLDRERLEKLTNALQKEISERKQIEVELIKAKEKAEAGNSAKSIFLANMSHEIRTPLNAILGFTSLLKNQSNMSLENTKKLEIIGKSGEHLLKMVNDILNMAKIEAGRIKIEASSLSLQSLIKDVINMMQNGIDEKNLELVIDYNPDLLDWIESDAVKLKQILINLLGNAIKFTPKGTINLKIDLSIQESSKFNLLIEIKDSGIGISPEDQQRIFEPFMQVENLNFQKGTGLGLPIIKKYAELMNGTVSVISEPNKGSIFRVELPITVINYNKGSKTSTNHNFLASGKQIFSNNLLLTEDLLNILSCETKSELKNALIVLDTEEINSIIQKITAQNQDLGKVLKTYIDKFDFMPIIKMLENPQPLTPSH